MNTADSNPVPPPAGDAAPMESVAPAAQVVSDALQAALSERDAHWEKYLRAEAELDNFRRRMNREREEERRYAVLPMVRDLLPTIDNLQRALEAGKKEAHGADGPLLQGVDMVVRQMLDTLERHGVKVIPAQGQQFNPNLHEALQQIPTGEYPPMTILQEVEQGFLLHDRVLRPSKVLVASAPQSTP